MSCDKATVFDDEALIYSTRVFRVTLRSLRPSIHTKEKVIMKKFIQICSLFGLLVFVGAATANAQSLGSQISIPFAFHVGEKSYDAGDYILKVDKLSSGTATLTIRDTNSDEAQVVLLNGNGESPTSEVKLVFVMIEGQRYLTRVRTPVRTFALIRSKAEKDAAKIRNSEKESGASAAGTSNAN